ncbi:MAG: diaminopimelate decarboxylase [Eubacteriales bacterium]|nr:diaminopimelate decarboxylase [Eubacteriales bacterium]
MEKRPFLTLPQLQEIVKTYPTPFHIYDEQAIRENARRVKAAFAWDPRFKEYFAVKATPNPRLLQILHEEGFGCDCSSYPELLLSKACGITGHEIMFSSNVTPAADFKLASDLDAIINFDDITHLAFYDKIGEWKETMSCRFNPGGHFVLDNEIMDSPQQAKYGMTREQLIQAFRYMQGKGVKHFGIHAFLASNTVENEYYPALARILFELAVEVQRETGVHIAFINLSGGVGIPYRPTQQPSDIMVIGEGVRRAYQEVLVPAGMDDVAIYTEMGRFILGPYGALVAQCIHQKHTYKEYVGLDACAADLMRPAMYGAYHHITVLGKEDALCDHVYDVTGGLCENNDKFAIDRALPEIAIGDYLYIHDTGAHGYSMGYNYNAKLRSAELLLRTDGTVEQIRRAETVKDYFSTLDCTGLLDGIE